MLVSHWAFHFRTTWSFLNIVECRTGVTNGCELSCEYLVGWRQLRVLGSGLGTTYHGKRQATDYWYTKAGLGQLTYLWHLEIVILFLSFIYYFYSLCVCVGGYPYHMHACASGDKGPWIPGTGIRDYWQPPRWVLGSKPRSFVRAVRAFNHWAFSPAPVLIIKNSTVFIFAN